MASQAGRNPKVDKMESDTINLVPIKAKVTITKIIILWSNLLVSTVLSRRASPDVTSWLLIK